MVESQPIEFGNHGPQLIKLRTIWTLPESRRHIEDGLEVGESRTNPSQFRYISSTSAPAGLAKKRTQ